jgi:hypothetical protein
LKALLPGLVPAWILRTEIRPSAPAEPTLAAVVECHRDDSVARPKSDDSLTDPVDDTGEVGT